MSKETSTHTFASSGAKDYIRYVIDRDAIINFKDRLFPSRKLSYLGLPGPQLLDILSWREYLNCCTAVEDSATADALETNILLNRLEGMVDVVRGNMDNLLLTGSSRLHWPYQLVNLDYTGGLIHTSTKGHSRSSQRLDAIKQLFVQQLDQPFLFLLTINLRNKDLGELADLIRMQEEDLIGLGFAGVTECFDRHRGLNYAGLLKLYVPIFLDNTAVHHSLVFSPPILYQGTKQMMHFIVECIPYTNLGAGRVSTTKQRVDLINLPLLSLHSYERLKRNDLGRIEIAPGG